jgi:Amt family ammonium transporter
MKYLLKNTAKILLVMTCFLVCSQVIAQESSDTFVTKDELANVSSNIDRLWVLLAAAMVFFMQAGFKALEVGLVRPQHSTAVALKNVVDWLVVSLSFFVVGFASMFGHSAGGFIGTDLFLLSGINEGHSLGIVFFLFQLAFAGTSVTIVSGAMSERTGFIAYLVLSLFIGLVIYPVFGHWAWGNLFFEKNAAWLADLGFIDFAGSTVVHSVGAWIALIGIWTVGPRIGRYNSKGGIQPMGGNNVAYSVLGVFILWFGWWGFNGGSTLKLDGTVGEIILNTNISGAVGGLVAFYHAYLFQKKRDIYEKLLGGVLGGLVAITACCHVVTPIFAVVIGFGAGIVHNISYELLSRRWKLDDPVGAIPVHGFCGVWGTLSVGFFADASRFPEDWNRLNQIGIQFLGVVVCFVFTVTLAIIILQILKITVGLRVSPIEEKVGLYFTSEEDNTEEEEEIDAETLMNFMDGLELDDTSSEEDVTKK